MELKNMEHRVVHLDLSSPDEPTFAICEVSMTTQERSAITL